MWIKFPIRGQFVDEIEKAISNNKANLATGLPIKVKLNPGGFDATVRVKISQEHPHEFWADWNQKNASWFPARIKNAAWALQRQGVFGEFEITHNNGNLAIK